MFGRREGLGVGIMVLASILLFSQVVVLLLAVYRLAESVPRFEPVMVSAIERTSVYDRRSRTVQSPPAKVDADETTDHTP